MKLALAQIQSTVGDVAANVTRHTVVAAAAAELGAQVVVFPELSLSGYEPRLCDALALAETDSRLAELAHAAAALQVTLVVGAPLRGAARPRIALLVIGPDPDFETHTKQYLHADELPWFEPGPDAPKLLPTAPPLGLAICYELSVEAHAKATFAAGAGGYVASVAKTAHGVAAAHTRLAAVARQFAAPAAMANCIGPCDGVVCAGGSAAWRRDGTLAAQLDATVEGLLLFDPATERATTRALPRR